MKKYIKLMRVHHYIKNGLVLLPLIFSGQLFNYSLLMKSILGALSFCFISSVVYIINDSNDAENDRKHPKKCNRPIASGAISVKNAVVFGAILLCISLAINLYIVKFNMFSWFYILLYFALNLSYSLKLKNYPIIDVAILASGFFLRVLYGSSVTNIEISGWLYLTVIAVAFYLGLGKRRNELIQSDKTNDTRKVLNYYNYNFLDKNMYMCLTAGVVFYSLWCVDLSTIERIGTENLIWTVPLVVLICMKYSLNIEGKSDGDPVEVLIKDKILVAMVCIFAMLVIGIVYL